MGDLPRHRGGYFVLYTLMLHLFSGSVFGYSWKSRLVVLTVNVIGIGLALGAGTMLDRTMGTSPAFMVTSLLLSFPVVQYATAKVLLRRHRSSHQTPPTLTHA